MEHNFYYYPNYLTTFEYQEINLLPFRYFVPFDSSVHGGDANDEILQVHLL
jgi:hypothetical protein